MPSVPSFECRVGGEVKAFSLVEANNDKKQGYFWKTNDWIWVHIFFANGEWITQSSTPLQDGDDVKAIIRETKRDFDLST